MENIDTLYTKIKNLGFERVDKSLSTFRSVISNDVLSICYISQDIIININDYCYFNICFISLDGDWLLKEFTINITNKTYGYKHCKLEITDQNKITTISPNTELTESLSNDIIRYLSNVKRLDNYMLELLWKNSLTRTSYKYANPYFKMNNNYWLIDNNYIKDIIFVKSQNKGLEILNNQFENYILNIDKEIYDLIEDKANIVHQI